MNYIFVTVREYPDPQDPTTPMRVVGIERRDTGLINSQYDALRSHVEGYIEYAVMPRGCRFEIVVNEEGLYTQPYNPLVSKFFVDLWLEVVNREDLDMTRCNLHGPAVITAADGGPITDELWAEFCTMTGAGEP
jgi:hypothetical protein